MKNLIRFLGACAVGAGLFAAWAAVAADAATDAATLRHLKEVLWPRAYAEQDVALLDSILADEFRLIDADGNWFTKQDELDYIRDHQPGYDSLTFAVKRLEIFENGTAIVAGEGTVRGRDAQGSYVSTYQSTNVLIRRDGRWRAISSHVSGVKRGMPGAAAVRESALELAGVRVHRGMSQESLRTAFPAGAIQIVEKAEGVADDYDLWMIRGGPDQGSGRITFSGGRVERVSRDLGGFADPETYAAFALVNRRLIELTGGRDTCLMIRSSIPQEIFPQSQVFLALPERIVELSAYSRDEGIQRVSIGESTRVNPVPASARVQQGMGDTAHCAFVE